MTFQFRFESILQLRRRQRDEKGADVGQANEAIRRVDQQVAALRDERTSLLDQAAGQRIGDVSVDALLSRGRYDLQLQADIQALSETRATLMQELVRRQQALADAEAEVKRFDRLKAKEETAYRAQLLRRQQAEADDIAGQRYSLGKQR